MAAKSAPDGYTIGLGGIASHAIAPTGIDAPIEVKGAPLSAAGLGRTAVMWTPENRARYGRSKLRYPSDLTDEEWPRPLE